MEYLYEKVFKVDSNASDLENCFIDIENIGTVVITLDEDSKKMIVSIFPLWVSDNPLKETKISYKKLINP